MKYRHLLSISALAMAMGFASQSFAHQLTIHNDSAEKLEVDAVTYQTMYQQPGDTDEFDDDVFNVSPFSNYFMPFEVVSDSAVVQFEIKYFHAKMQDLTIPICVIELGDFNADTGTFQSVIENARVSKKHSCTYNAVSGTISVH